VAEPRNNPVIIKLMWYTIIKIKGRKINVEPLPKALMNRVILRIHILLSRFLML
jgi:hypothetical protein